ncbi:MAG: hypothetical protein ACRDIV_13345 [Ktedonobacteraceae bacterium]
MTKTTRLLLPFTHGVEMETLEAAILLAASHHAILVPLALVPASQANGKGARLEHIQQSKDFLEAAQHKAARHHVPLERLEAFTSDVAQSIAVLGQQVACDGVILALRGRKGSLLSAGMIEQLMAMRPCSLFLIYLPTRESSWVVRLRERFSRLLPGYRQRAEKHTQLSPARGEQALPDAVLAGYVGSPDEHSQSKSTPAS